MFNCNIDILNLNPETILNQHPCVVHQIQTKLKLAFGPRGKQLGEFSPLDIKALVTCVHLME